MRHLLHRRASFQLGIAIPIVLMAVSIGVVVILQSLAAVQTAFSLDPGSGSTVSGAATKGTDSAAGTTYVQFGAPAAVYCGGRVPAANCIGASELAAHRCTTNAACQAAGFACWATNTNAFVYDLTNYGARHGGGKGEILNPAICGREIHPILARTAPDGAYGTISNISKHNSASANTQGTFLGYRKTGFEYDPTKP